MYNALRFERDDGEEQRVPKLTTRNLTIGVGVLLVLLSVLAAVIGLGREPRFGWKQGIGVAVGLALVVGGTLWGRVSR